METTTLAQLGDNLQQLQQNVKLLRSLSDSYIAQPLPDLLAQVCAQQDVVAQLRRRIETKLASAATELESLPRAQQARARATHGKLRKDYDRVSAALAPVIAKVAELTTAPPPRALPGTRFAGSAGGAASRGGGYAGGGGAFGEAEESPRGRGGGNEPTQIGGVQLQMHDEHAIEDAILREREDEIKEINKNVHQVNEIFRDLATIVNKQQEDINDISEMTEKSHKSASAGLEQVNRAAKLQPSCTMS